MSKKEFLKAIILFVIFFLLTIGNGKYIIDHFGNKVEIIGIAILLITAMLRLPKNINSLKKDLKIIGLAFILSCGAFYNNISNDSKIMIVLSALLLMNYSKFSELFITDSGKIKLIGDAILLGMIANAIIGALTGTLGLNFSSNLSFIKIIFLSGIKVKNYCGGIWLVTYILYYVFYHRKGNVDKHIIRFIILFMLILLSGSKGALLLCVLFTLFVNFNKVIKIKKTQKKVFYMMVAVVGIIISIYVYKNVLINIPTYAYRMRGLQKLIDIYINDFSKFIFGMSDVAYANTGFDYTVNMRNYLGWEASVEMAYVNILIKNGFLGFLVYFIVFKEIIKKAKEYVQKDKIIIYSVVLVMLLSGFTETYIASIHYVVGPTLFCLVNGIIYANSNKTEEKKWLN